MSDPATQNTRARAALRGEWQPGMRSIRRDGRVGRLYRWRDTLRWEREDGIGEYDAPLDACPDLDDPVTALALLVVLRRRLGAPLAQVSPALDDGAFWVVYLNDGSDRSFRGPTEAAALIAALEAT